MSHTHPYRFALEERLTGGAHPEQDLTASPCTVATLGACLLHRGLDIFGSSPVDCDARLTAPDVTHSSYWGLVCREPDIMDWIYSDAHPPRIGHINCVFFIDHVCQAPAWTISGHGIISAAPRPAGDQTPPPNPPPAKKQKQSWVINPDPYVPRTTKIPEPSLKPLPTRPWERSAEEVDAHAAAEYEKWKADCKKKREPEPKQVFSDKEKSWAKSFLNTPSQAAKNLPDDYLRELRRQALAFKRNQELAEKKALEEEAEKKLERGKEVAQLGEQSKQSIAPLIVQAAGPDAPDIIAAAAAHGLTVTSAREQAADLGITLRALLGLDEAPMKDVVFTYVKNGPLVEPAQEEDLPRQMKGLLNWYKGYIKHKNAKDYIYAEVRYEHHFKHYYVQIHLSELFQLFNLRDLDKSIISCYVLMKKREMRIRNIHDVGFIDPQIVNSYVLEHHPADVEDDLWRFIRKQELKSDILFPYHFG
ncbi:uncharacterized protein [Lolium perenne]|uniref:uncharacterized protein n=1 Tax=Lolium perenne TaxID=4522 RepID=UPI003A98F605